MSFQDLKRNLAKDFSALPVRRLALLGDTATQFLAQAIKGHGIAEKINFEIFEADFDQLNSQILDSASELYRSRPEFVVLCVSAEKLWPRLADAPLEEKPRFAETILAEIKNWWLTIAKSSSARVIQFNFIEINDGVFGNFATKTPASFPFQIKKLNYELMCLAQQHKHVFLLDVCGLSSQVGYERVHDPRLYASYKVAFALDFLPALAKGITDIVKAVSGDLKKCLILDLDNTLWGGVIGDDGMEKIEIGELGMGHAYDALQKWARELKRRGVILAVCSKNDEAVARKPFQEHPDMTLRLEDIAVFVANWDNKADNIRHIQRILGIGFDSMVYVDDNPFERNLVRSLLPAVTIPELPEDPNLYVSYLASLNLFETASLSAEDEQRTRQYQAEAARTDAQKEFTSIDDYLRSLDMKSAVKSFDSFSAPRVAQLTQRSNQFNLRTVRYTEADIERMMQSDRFVTLSFQLEDKFGDHGLIGVVAIEKREDGRGFIDTWIMSCRVLKRGMEEFIVNQMARSAAGRGIKRLTGEYLPTAKNGMVKELYPHMGFAPRDGMWELELEPFKELKTFIRPK